MQITEENIENVRVATEKYADCKRKYNILSDVEYNGIASLNIKSVEKRVDLSNLNNQSKKEIKDFIIARIADEMTEIEEFLRDL